MKIKIGIIGGGFSGAMLARHLLNSKQNLEIYIFNNDAKFGRGIAYQAQIDSLLLNVPAGKMSAYSNQPDHFVEWLKENNENSSEVEQKFFNRNIYGLYLSALWEETKQLAALSDHILTPIIGKVLQIIPIDGALELQTNELNLSLDFCILACGNALPSHPKFISEKDFNSKLYSGNPWRIKVKEIQTEKEVLILGAGLTMVDAIQVLRANGFKGKVNCISPHGFKILPYEKSSEAVKSELLNIKTPIRLSEILKLFHQEMRLHPTKITDLVALLRLKSGAIWSNFTHEERDFFMRHLRHKWGVARHRIPHESYSILQDEIKSKSLQIHAGKITAMNFQESTILVEFQERNSKEKRRLSVQHVINCTGPSSDITIPKDDLLFSLFKNGIIQADPLFLGIKTDVNTYQVYSKERYPIYALGNLLKGELWETTAINELRIQCEELAQVLINTFNKQ
jgi:uncharacterized NAD(P)/FAD-binding protein YdhS